MKKFKRILAVILTMSMILAIPVLAGAATKTDLYFADVTVDWSGMRIC